MQSSADEMRRLPLTRVFGSPDDLARGEVATDNVRSTRSEMIPTLTGLLNGKTHLSQHMAEAYPNTLALRRDIRDTCGPILFTPGISRDGGPAGSAFDMLVTLTVDPDRVPLDPSFSLVWREAQAELTAVVAERAAAAVKSGDRSDDALRAVWILGLLVSSIRSIQSYVHSPVTAAVVESSGVEETLARLHEVIPPAGLDEIRQLDAIASVELYPELRDPVYLHPWLGNDALMAEADIITDGLLLDLKSSRGKANAAGEFGLLPTPKDIYQILIYALLNRGEPQERFGPVTDVGIYAARYGTLIAWPLEHLMFTLAGKTLDPDDERQHLIMLAYREVYDPFA